MARLVDRMFVHHHPESRHPLLPPAVSSRLSRRWHLRPGCIPHGARLLIARLTAGHHAEDERRNPGQEHPDAADVLDPNLEPGTDTSLQVMAGQTSGKRRLREPRQWKQTPLFSLRPGRTRLPALSIP